MAMPKRLILFYYCLIDLAKFERLWDLIKLIKFLKSWHGVFKYTQEIFYYLDKNYLLLNFNTESFKTNFLSKIKQKLIL